MPGNITFLNEIPRFLIGISAAALLAFLAFAFFRFSVPVPLKTRIFLAALRTAWMALLVFVILDPYWNVASGKEWVGIVIDSSASMEVTDVENEGRLSAWKKTVQSGTLWKYINQENVKKIVSAAETVKTVSSMEEISAIGNESALLAAVRTLNAEYGSDRELLGWILVSDGAATDYPDDSAEWPEKLFFPWIGIAMGGEREVENITVDAVTHSAHVFLSEITPLEVAWESSMSSDTPCELSIKVDNETVQNRVIVCSEENYKTELKLMAVGDHFITTTVKAKGSEASTVDNEVKTWLSVSPRTIKVYYTESYYKDKNDFKLALEEDADFEVSFSSSLIGFARKESLPFVKDPIHGLPENRERMLSYDVIVLSDVRRNLLSAEQIEWIRELVEEHGGALIMIGGVDSFGDGGYVGSAIEKMLPVEISEEYKKDIFLAARGTVENPFRPQIAPGAENHPLLQLTGDKDTNLSLWGSMPLLGGYNYVGRLKPGAQMILQHPVDLSSFGKRGIMAVQSYGKGKTLAFTSDITYNWGQWFLDWRDAKEGWLFASFWRGVLKWLTENRMRKDVNQLDIVLSPALPEAGLPLHIKATEPGSNNQSSSLEYILSKEGRPIDSRRMDQLMDEEPVWTLQHLEPGDYSLKAVLHSSSLPPESQVHPFSVLSSRKETARLSTDHDFLRELSHRSDGIFLEFSRLQDLPDAIQKLRKKQLRDRSTPFWNQVWIYSSLIVLLCIDWFIRKVKGLE